jgi:F0F1-type ATP synthase membrane subunit b/b'
MKGGGRRMDSAIEEFIRLVSGRLEAHEKALKEAEEALEKAEKALNDWEDEKTGLEES